MLVVVETRVVVVPVVEKDAVDVGVTVWVEVRLLVSVISNATVVLENVLVVDQLEDVVLVVRDEDEEAVLVEEVLDIVDVVDVPDVEELDDDLVEEEDVVLVEVMLVVALTVDVLVVDVTLVLVVCVAVRVVEETVDE